MQVYRNRRIIVSLIQCVRFSSAEAVARSSRELEGDVKPFSAIPGPKPLPVLRNLLELKRNLPRLGLYLEECYKKYGKIFKLETPGIDCFLHFLCHTSFTINFSVCSAIERLQRIWLFYF